MKRWSVNKWHSYLLCGMFLIAQFIAVAHLPVHILESIQATYELTSDEQAVQLEQCGICLAADYLDSGIVESQQLQFSVSPLLLAVDFSAKGLETTPFTLYLSRAPPEFS